jgi:hypothetical protein
MRWAIRKRVRACVSCELFIFLKRDYYINAEELCWAEERVRQEMRGGAMETYKLVVVVVKPFVDANMWRKGLAQRLSNLEERTQEVIYKYIIIISLIIHSSLLFIIPTKKKKKKKKKKKTQKAILVVVRNTKALLAHDLTESEYRETAKEVAEMMQKSMTGLVSLAVQVYKAIRMAEEKRKETEVNQCINNNAYYNNNNNNNKNNKNNKNII